MKSTPYSIEKQIGEGAWGKVFLARGAAGPVALKFLKPDLGAGVIGMFREEVRLLSRLSHPNLIRIFDFHDSPDGPYYSMEYLQGQSFEGLRNLKFAELARLLIQTCQGLRYLHHRQILHGDLKPANLWLDPAGMVKILDFGLARDSQAQSREPRVGTLAFSPPEAFLGELDAQSDLFALGVVFYRLACGHLPFQRALLPEDLTAIPEPESLANRRDDLPDFFVALIHRLLSFLPADRPLSAYTILKYLSLHMELPADALAGESREVYEKLPLVGRERELAAFQSILAEGIGGSHLIHVTGPTGVGRSRLLAEMKWQSIFAKWPWVTVGPDDVDKLKTDHRLLVIPNFQRWPESKRSEAEFQISQNAGSRSSTLWIVETNDDAFHWQKLDALSEDSGLRVHRWALEDLSQGDTRRLIEAARLDRDLDSLTIDRIARASGGRPILALEGLRQVLKNEGSPASDVDAAIPHSFQDLIPQKISGLAVDTRSLLALVLAHPWVFTLAELSNVFAESGSDFADAWLAAQAASLMTADAVSGVQLRHPSLRQAYFDSMDPSERQEAHRRWLTWLQSASAAADPVIILHHAAGANDAQALQSIGIAALQKLEKDREPEVLIQQSEILVEQNQLTIDRVWLHMLRATAFYQLGRYPEALEAYRQWLEVRPDDGSGLVPLRYHFYRGLTHFAAGDLESAEIALRESLGNGDPDRHPALRPYLARVENLLAAISERKTQYREAEGHLEAALRFAGEEDALVGEVEQRLGALAISQYDWAGAEAHFQKALDCYRRTGAAQREAIALHFLAKLDRERGALASAENWQQQALEKAREGGERLQAARYLGNLALIHLFQGRIREAQDELSFAQPVIRTWGNSVDLAVLDLTWLQLFSCAGNFKQTDRLWGLVAGRLAGLSEWDHAIHRIRGEDLLRQGRWRESEAELLRGLGEAPSDRIPTLLAIGRLAARTDQRAMLERVLRELPEAPQWLRFLAAEPENDSRDQLNAVLAAIKSEANPWQRVDQYLDIALRLARAELPNIAENFFQAYRHEWSNIRNQLPEEMKMDFEKNQGLRSLEEALGGSRPKPETTPAASAPRESEASISEAKFRHFCEINRQIAEKTDLEDILERVMDAAIELTQAERGFLILEDAAATAGELQGFTVKTARRINQQALEEEDFKFSLGTVKTALREGMPILTNNAMADSRFQEMKSVVQYQLKAILVVPLEAGGKTFGAIYLDHRYEPNCFSPEDVVMLAGFSNQATLAIQNAQMMAQLKNAKKNLETTVQEQAHHIEALAEELSQARTSLKYEYPEIVGKSQAMMRVFQLLDHVTQTKIPVWIFGESGTGKELIARSLHFNSARKKGPFVTENCSAIPENLLESEFFGYKKGSFTHADRDRVGLFEMASGGTLFLDEVADMSLAMQAKLLRVLQEGEVRPLGSNKPVKIDVRLVTASNKDLRKLVREEKFRQDLFYRINGMTIPLPNLRQRKADIPLLIHHLTKKIAKEYELKPSSFTQETIQMLIEKPWEGNIRELEGVVRNALLFAGGQAITKKTLLMSEGFAPPEAPAFEEDSIGAVSGGVEIESNDPQNQERRKIIELIKKHSFDKKKIADELNLSLKSVYNLMERLGIPKKKSELERFLDEKQ